MWTNLKVFEGRWQGTGTGQPGNSTVQRTYEFIFNDKFLQVKNRSIYPPQDKNLNGEVHEDMGLFSYDTTRKLFILRQFHVEGFVNQYVLDYLAPDAKTLVFTTEAIENIPTGWRARETYQILNPDEFVEIFELAAPGKEFELYVRNQFRRVG